MTTFSGDDLNRQIENYRAINPQFAGADRAEARRQEAAHKNRIARLAECGNALDTHTENLNQSIANFQALRDRLIELAPARVKARWEEELRNATASGDGAAAADAARVLVAVEAGLGEEANERKLLEERVRQVQADAKSAMVSFDKAADEALRDRLVALEKEMAKAARAYEGAAQAAFERRESLKAAARAYLEVVAALGRSDPHANPNYAPLARPSDSIELPPVQVPNIGTVRSRGGAQRRG